VLILQKLSTSIQWKGSRSDILHSIARGVKQTLPMFCGGWVNARIGLISCAKCHSHSR